MASDHDRLDRLAVLAGRPWRAEELTGGLTNRNYRVVTTDDRRPAIDMVARCWLESSQWLAIDRQAEQVNSRRAAATGVAPEVVAFQPEVGILAVEFLDGVRTCTDDDLRDPSVVARVAAACRRLHAGPLFATDFDMFAIQAEYLTTVREHGFRLPADYLDFADQADQIRAAMAARREQLVPCHNDLLAANLLDDGTRVRIIDFEYAGNNESSFELGNIWSEASLGLDELAMLVGAYDGTLTRARVARARLWGLMSKYGWTLWASLMDATSEIDFDFWGWGMEKYDRAVAEFRGPDFARLLTEVADG